MNHCVRVLFVQHVSCRGGSGTMLVNLLSALDRTAFEAVVLCPPGEMVDEFRAAGAEIVLASRPIRQLSHYTGLHYSFANPRFWVNLVMLWRDLGYWETIFKTIHPDIVHLNGITLAPMVTAARNSGAKVACLVQETLVRGCIGARTAWIRRLLSRMDAVIFISDYDRNSARCKASIIATIPNWVAPEYFHSSADSRAARKRYDLDERASIVLMMGGVSRVKGTLSLVRAVAKMRDIPGLKILIAGDCGELVSSSGFVGRAKTFAKRLLGRDYRGRVLRKIRKEKLGEVVRFIGNQREVVPLYTACDVVAFPATVPHQARPVFEAGAMAKPVVVSEFPHLREFVKHGENAWLVPPGNSDELSVALRALLSDESLRKRLGEANYEIVKAKNNVRINGSRYNELLRKLTGISRREVETNLASRDPITEQRAIKREGGKIQLAFVGSVFPDEERYRTLAFSRAGVSFQRNLLNAMKDSGIDPSRVFSILQCPSFPRYGKIWIRGSKVMIPQEINVTLLSFINITPVKQLMIGCSIFFRLTVWGMRNWKIPHKVILTYNLSVPPGLFTYWAGRLVKAKVVASLNDINVPGETVPNRLLYRMDFWLQRKLIPRLDGRIVVSDSIAEDFGGSPNDLRLEGGISDETVRLFAKAQEGGPVSGRFRMTFAGRLDETNGIPLIIEAFSMLQEQNFELCLAGSGPLQEQVEASVAKDPRIRFLGFLSLPELFALYQSSDLLLNIRVSDTLKTKYFFPSKLLEYMASGIPVVSTCVTHVEREFGELIYLLKQETAGELAEMFRRLARTPTEERLAKGEAARAYVLMEKSWTKQGERAVRYLRALFD